MKLFVTLLQYFELIFNPVDIATASDKEMITPCGHFILPSFAASQMIAHKLK